jgi:hypothetical protein
MIELVYCKQKTKMHNHCHHQYHQQTTITNTMALHRTPLNCLANYCHHQYHQQTPSPTQWHCMQRRWTCAANATGQRVTCFLHGH